MSVIRNCMLAGVALLLWPLAAGAAGYIKFDDIKGETAVRPSPDGRIDILDHRWGKGGQGTKVRTVVPVEPHPGRGDLTVSLPASASTRALEHYCGYKKLPSLSLFLPKTGRSGQYIEYRLEDVKVTCLPSMDMGNMNMGKMVVQEFQFSYARLKKQ